MFESDFQSDLGLDWLVESLLNLTLHYITNKSHYNLSGEADFQSITYNSLRDISRRVDAVLFEDSQKA